MRPFLIVIAVAALAQPGSAQQTQTSTESALIASLLNLPMAVEAARRAGIPGGTIWDVLDSLRRRR
ncbi:MAG TPA: hypothetical protein VF128_09775, partial [Gemmatimonadaceae bacterium]